jgi:hypothetical protein
MKIDDLDSLLPVASLGLVLQIKETADGDQIQYIKVPRQKLVLSRYVELTPVVGGIC